jgi:hypothetical protein
MTYSKVIDGLVTNLSFSITRASSKGLVGTGHVYPSMIYKVAALRNDGLYFNFRQSVYIT